MKTRQQMEEETYNARNVDIRFVADHFGYNMTRRGNTYMCDGTGNSLVLFTNSFFDYYAHSGGSPIDFVMRETGQNVRQAIEFLNELAGNYRAEETYEEDKRREVKIKNDRELVLPPRNENHRRVFAYLAKSRCISENVISEMLHKHMLYESADRHNAVFVAYDVNGCARHGFIRGTHSEIQFRGDCPGSNKDYGFAVPGSNDELLVFEAPIDLLSFMSLYPNNNSHKLALGMLSDEPIYRYIEEHSGIESVSFFLDNDKPGMEASVQFSEKLKANGFRAERNSLMDKIKEAGKKDVNEYLVSVRKSKQYSAPQQAQAKRQGR